MKSAVSNFLNAFLAFKRGIPNMRKLIIPPNNPKNIKKTIPSEIYDLVINLGFFRLNAFVL